MKNSTKNSTFPPIALRVNDACCMIGLGLSLLYRLIANGKIKPVKIAGMTVIPVAELQRFLGAGAK